MCYIPAYLLDIFGLILAILLYVTNQNSAKRSYDRILFGALTLLLSMLLITDAASCILDGAGWGGARFSHAAARFVYCLLVPLFCWTWLLYTDYWLESADEKLELKQYLYGIPMVIGIAMTVMNLRTGWLYRIDEQNIFYRGPCYFLIQLFYTLYVAYASLLAMYHAHREPNAIKKGRFRSIAFFMLFPACALVIQDFLLDLHTSLLPPALSLSLLMVYITIQQQRTAAQKLTSDRQEKHAAALENELMQNRISIMLSQIQPHFLYNSLTTIVDLCDTDANLAKKATIAFSQYLRGNMDSLRQTMPVPFAVEQKHIENYLWLEKLRFGDELTVVWDIQVTDFKLPSLSAQPLVENAVKYGVGKKPGGGTVTISTRELQHVYTVSVSDDGVGYNVMETQPDGRTHIGIDNVRSRLHYMCGGALTITSEPGKGTVATITLLKEEPT